MNEERLRVLAVDEVFYSLQGEGPNSGRPSVFVRLAPCNLKCSWCDTDSKEDLHKYVPVNNIEMKAPELYDKIISMSNLKRGEDLTIIFTGGEPLIQQEQLEYFLLYFNGRHIRDFGLGRAGRITIEIETNGTIVPTVSFDSFVDHYNISPKLLNSGNKRAMRERPNAYNFFVDKIGEKGIAFKFVLSQDTMDEDDEELRYLVDQYRIPARNIYIMPEGVEGKGMLLSAKKLADYCLLKKYNLCLRNHILIWGDRRGT